MLYAKYGRTGIYVLQSVFRDLGLRQDDESLRIVKETISSLPSDHLLQEAVKVAGDLQYDAGLVDVFLHGRDRGYTVEDCMELVTSAGLVFQTWLTKAPYYLHNVPSSPQDMVPPVSELNAAISALPEPGLWSVMECLDPSNLRHIFVACRPDRPKGSYTIDFSTRDCLDYVPLMRVGCGVAGTEIFRSDWSMNLTAAQLAFVQYVDGRRTIRDIAARAAQSREYRQSGTAQLEKFARKLFESLWRLDFLSMALSTKSHR
jgi:hypothetical protein